MSGVLVALDLDQTVVFSKRSAGEAGPSVVVEHLDGEPLSSMTVGAVEAYRALAATCTVIPVTTRTVLQYRRITLPTAPSHAVCANGGVLLHQGEPDAEWAEWVRSVCAQSAPVAEVEAHLDEVSGEEWVRLVRTAEGLFCYLVAHSREQIPGDWLAGLSTELEGIGWGVSVQGRKVYAVPAGLSKASAVQRLVDQLGATTLLAAGDSVLDQPLLELAGAGAVRPRHGELEELGWTGAHVTAASGARAGEELLGWLARTAQDRTANASA